MDSTQMIKVGYEETLDVKFKKTNLKKINTENSKCITDENFYGYEDCYFKKVNSFIFPFGSIWVVCTYKTFFRMECVLSKPTAVDCHGWKPYSLMKVFHYAKEHISLQIL